MNAPYWVEVNPFPPDTCKFVLGGTRSSNRSVLFLKLTADGTWVYKIGYMADYTALPAVGNADEAKATAFAIWRMT